MKPFLPILPFLAKYPFLKVAGRFLEFEYGDLESILNSDDELVSSARELGVRIVEATLKGEKVPELEDLKDLNEPFLCDECDVRDCVEKGGDLERFRFCDYPFHSSYKYLKHLNLAKKFVLAYLFSKIAVSNLSEALRRKFAVRMARTYREMLERESVGFLKVVVADFGINAKFVDGVFRVDVVDYLKGAVRIKAEEWKLVNRRLERGFVFLNKRELVRLLEEFLRDRLCERVEVGVKLEVKVESKSTDLEVRDLGIDVECYPPCMKKILSDLRNGVNVPHSARFAIAAFLLNIGMSVDDVVNVFRNAPDFDEDKTRYQVEHIAGQRGKGEEYICPSCETMKSYGNCYADESCSNVKHPVRYYVRCVKRRKDHSNKLSPQ